MKDTPELLTVGETMAAFIPTPSDPELFHLSIAGAESNVAIGAATLGIRAAWLSRVGTDPLGQHVIESIGNMKVDVSAVGRDASRRTGVMFKHPSSTGSTVSYYRADSAASHLSQTHLNVVGTPRMVHTTGITSALSSSTREVAEAILDGRFPPALSSFDVNYRPVLWASQSEAAATLLDLASRADVVFVGLDEAHSLWDVTHAEDVRELLPAVPHLIVKDADIEAVEFTRGQMTRVPTPIIDVVEPIGAGDAFAAGWIAAFLRGEVAEVRLRLGHACAAQVLATVHDTVLAAPPFFSTLNPSVWRADRD